MVSSNWDTTQFSFRGFLPKKKGKQTALKAIVDSDYPVYVYESVHRVVKTLEELLALGFAGKVMICRELTKLHEQYACGSIPQVLEMITLKELPLKGEFVLGFNARADLHSH